MIGSAIFGAINQRNQERALTSGLNSENTQIQGLINYLLGPGPGRAAAAQLEQQSNIDLNSLINEGGGGIMNRQGTIMDWRDKELQDSVDLITQVSNQARMEAGSLMQGQASQYGGALQAAESQPNPLLAAAMGLASMPGKTGATTAPTTATPTVVPATTATAPTLLLPTQTAQQVGAGGYFGQPPNTYRLPAFQPNS